MVYHCSIQAHELYQGSYSLFIKSRHWIQLTFLYKLWFLNTCGIVREFFESLRWSCSHSAFTLWTNVVTFLVLLTLSHSQSGVCQLFFSCKTKFATETKAATIIKNNNNNPYVVMILGGFHVLKIYGEMLARFPGGSPKPDRSLGIGRIKRDALVVHARCLDHEPATHPLSKKLNSSERATIASDGRKGIR